jgi:hypothetical protein
MGDTHPDNFRDAVYASVVHRDVWEWQATIELGLKNVDRAKFPDYIALIARYGDDAKPHAYTERALKALLTALKPDPAPSLPELRGWTDEFAVYVGHAIFGEPKEAPALRASKLQGDVIAPARHLQAALRDEGTELELLLSDTTSRLDIAALSATLAELERRATRCKDDAEQQKRRGKTWWSDVARHHVYTAALFCEFVNPTFQPARDKRFRAVCEILAQPLFPSEAKFIAAIREHAEAWKREVAQLPPEQRAALG